MLDPWVFGDEYIYISKARNINFGIDVISDASLGHTYPPLYSYLISLGVTDTAEQTYANIQLINFFASQALFLLAFFILNKIYHFTDSKRGSVFLVLAYLLTTTLSLVTGNYFVAMSENLYTPLIVLIFSVFLYVSEKPILIMKWAWLGILSILTALAILTRSIGLALIPTFLLCLTWLEWKKNLDEPLKNKMGSILLSVGIVLGVTWVLFTLFNSVEQKFVQNSIESASQNQYSSSPYLSVITDFFQGKNNLSASFKLIGNHFIYFFMSSFFLPILFYINEITKVIKNKSIKKISPEFIFLTCFGLFSLGLSYLHTYLGYRDHPIKYSTYFRYVDPTVALFVVYGLLRLWKLLQQKIKLDNFAISLFVIFSFVFTLMLPERDFYITINSLGWGWLDLLKGQQWLIQPLTALLIASMLLVIKFKPKLLSVFALGIVIANLLTTRLGYLDMHRWLAGIYQDNVDHIYSQLVSEQNINTFYLNKPEKGSDHSYLYYLKYRLLFDNKEFIPMPIIDWQEEGSELLQSEEPFVLVDKAGITYEQAEEESSIEDKWRLTLFNHENY